jgi:hypothetical protein
MLGGTCELIAPNFKMRFKDLEPQSPCSSGSGASKRAGVRPFRKIIDLETPELELHIQHDMNVQISLVH